MQVNVAAISESMQIKLTISGSNKIVVITRIGPTITSSGGGGAVADVIQNYVSGATVTQTPGANYIVLNPATVIASLTLTTAILTSLHPSNDIYIVVGGTITSGNVVITNFNIVAGAGLTLVQAIDPNGNTLYAGEVLRYHKVGNSLYRID